MAKQRFLFFDLYLAFINAFNLEFNWVFISKHRNEIRFWFTLLACESFGKVLKH